MSSMKASATCAVASSRRRLPAVIPAVPLRPASRSTSVTLTLDSRTSGIRPVATPTAAASVSIAPAATPSIAAKTV